MRYTLQTSFVMDDTDPDQNELIEAIRKEVSEVISEYSETWRPKVKIWDEQT